MSLKIEVKANGEWVSATVNGHWGTTEGPSASVEVVGKVANYPVVSCFSEQEIASGARTMAAQIWARASDQLRRSTIHAIDAALQQTMGRAAGRPGAAVMVDVRQVGGDLVIDITPAVSRPD